MEKDPTSHVIDPKVIQANCSRFLLRKNGQWPLHMKIMTAPHKQIYLHVQCTFALMNQFDEYTCTARMTFEMSLEPKAG